MVRHYIIHYYIQRTIKWSFSFPPSIELALAVRAAERGRDAEGARGVELGPWMRRLDLAARVRPGQGAVSY